MNPNEKFSMTLDYLFGKGVSLVIPIDRLDFTFSKRTGKMKNALLDGKLMAMFRPDGSIVLTIYGAELLIKHPRFKDNCVVVKDEAKDFVSKGRSVFAKHVMSCGKRVRPKSEVAVLDISGKVIAVGKALLSAKMMRQFRSGVAVKVRQGIKK
ncbi:MAG: queuine tRNA-ribosyltransferase [archaeon]|nr:queuine tRNA-ribosyltransferase [archaeon]MCP8306846.1 queuine tRNA-ribosyltransferase [archaeon]